jgi:hypothetical protein
LKACKPSKCFCVDDRALSPSHVCNISCVSVGGFSQIYAKYNVDTLFQFEVFNGRENTLHKTRSYITTMLYDLVRTSRFVRSHFNASLVACHGTILLLCIFFLFYFISLSLIC